MQKINTMRTTGDRILKEDKLTIGLDLGDRFSTYCILEFLNGIDSLEGKTIHLAIGQCKESRPTEAVHFEAMHSYWEWLAFRRVPNPIARVAHQMGRLESSERDRNGLNQWRIVHRKRKEIKCPS